MSSKRWLFILLPAAIALTMCCCAVLNILVDPFGVFGDPILDWYSFNVTNNPRIAKLVWLDKHHEQYDSYVIGSSSAASYNVEELNDYFGASFYNLFVYGCDTKDYRDFTAYVLNNYTVKNIVLNLGVNEATSYDKGENTLNNRMHAKASGRNLALFYLRYALSATRQSMEKLSARARDTELPQEFDVFLIGSGCYDKRVRDVEKIGDPAVYEIAYADDFYDWQEGADLPCTAECIQAVADIRDMCAGRGVRLTVIASPVYIGQWELCDNSALRAYKTALAETVDYWDFSFTTISYDSRYFYDQTHFRNAVGTMMLAEIFGNSDIYRPENFGTWVTAENREAYIDGLFSSPPAADANSTADVPVLIYHGIVPEPVSDLDVSPEAFDGQMRFLAENGYHAVTTSELIDFVYHGGELPDKPVFISFDDGYLNNYEYAWPILEQYGLKATVYAIGVSVGHDRFYKDTQFEMTPHFSYEQAREMMASGVIDIQSHTYDMHQWEPFETGDRVRGDVRPFEDESEADYIAALTADIEQYNSLAEQELGRAFTSLAYPGGEYDTLTEVAVHQAGIPVTMSTRTDSRNILVRGLPQSLYALCRWPVTEETTEEELLAILNG